MMMRHTLTLILLFASCSAASAATEPITEPHINTTIWLTSGDDVQIFQLPPGAGGCAAVPPYYCKEIEDCLVIILDPSELPLHSSPYSHIAYQANGEDFTQPINSTIYNLTVLAPTSCPVLWIFVFLLILVWKPR
jgi:hypothetical protein